ncbi:MAG: sugar kinase [Oscillatoria sp. SIO1A7]|nr:sugar kinase [Oscillatoria sp. SIO1A7]
MYRGLFVGLVTLDLVYLAPSVPENNEKLVAADYAIASGGPATNAAVTFAHLGNQATVLGAVGRHPITQLLRADLESCGVTIFDLDPNRTEPPPVSSIIVTQNTGDRAVISINATKSQIAADKIPPELWETVDIVLIDGHQMAASEKIARLARDKNIPAIVDGGSWKPGFEKVLSFVDCAICSANFFPPNCQNSEDVFAYLSELGIANIAITHGEKPIEYFRQGQRGTVAVPQIEPLDTLGAGDIFHGAFCFHILQQDFTTALAEAARVAAYACQFFGSRRWMQEL